MAEKTGITGGLDLPEKAHRSRTNLFAYLVDLERVSKRVLPGWLSLNLTHRRR